MLTPLALILAISASDPTPDAGPPRPHAAAPAPAPEQPTVNLPVPGGKVVIVGIPYGTREEPAYDGLIEALTLARAQVIAARDNELKTLRARVKAAEAAAPAPEKPKDAAKKGGGKK